MSHQFTVGDLLLAPRNSSVDKITVYNAGDTPKNLNFMQKLIY